MTKLFPGVSINQLLDIVCRQCTRSFQILLPDLKGREHTNYEQSFAVNQPQ